MKTIVSLGVGASDPGLVRENNEDSYHIDDELGLYVVADGMGGHASGEVASKLAVEALTAELTERWSEVEAVLLGKEPPGPLEALLEAAIHRANRTVFQRASQQMALSGMGCTTTALLVLGEHAVLGHVGDSRMYLLRAGKVHQLSQDHTMAEELCEAGVIKRADIRGHPYAHVLSRVVGNKPEVQVDLLSFGVLPGDRILLCTDGLSDVIETPEWLAGALGADELEDVPDRLIAHANDHGGKDNSTVVVVAVELEKEAICPPRLHETSELVDILDDIFLFRGLSFAQRIRVLNCCATRTWNKGQTVITRGEELQGMTILLEGGLEVSHPRYSVQEVGPSQCLGEASLLADQKARADVKAEERSHGLYLDGATFRRLGRARPWLGRRMLQRLGHRLTQLLTRARRREEGEEVVKLAGELV